jgi:hypothetical protein
MKELQDAFQKNIPAEKLKRKSLVDDVVNAASIFSSVHSLMKHSPTAKKTSN